MSRNELIFFFLLFSDPAKPGMLLFISSPIAVNWENYVVTANWRLDPVPANDFEQFQATTTQMVERDSFRL